MSRSRQGRLGLEPRTSGGEPTAQDRALASPAPPPRRSYAPAPVRAGADLRARAPHPRPEQPRNGHVTQVPRSTYPSPPRPSDSAPPWLTLDVSRASAWWPQSLTPPPPGMRPARRSYSVTRAQALRFYCVHIIVFLSLQKRATFLRKRHFSPHYS